MVVHRDNPSYTGVIVRRMMVIGHPEQKCETLSEK
jgi:hypothetical protein